MIILLISVCENQLNVVNQKVVGLVFQRFRTSLVQLKKYTNCLYKCTEEKGENRKEENGEKEGVREYWKKIEKVREKRGE